MRANAPLATAKSHSTDLMLLFLSAFAIWSAIHSLTASASFKTKVRNWVGQRPYDGLYRFSYNVFAVLSFLPVLYLAAAALPSGVLWSVPRPLSLVFVLLQIGGLVCLVVSLLQTDPMQFAGLGQALRYLRGENDINPPSVLVTSGMYCLVRHPIYSFSLVVLWLMPVMTWGTLVFNLAATLYFWIGSVYEERRLTAAFGDAYLEYMQQVPRLVPVKLPTMSKTE